MGSATHGPVPLGAFFATWGDLISRRMPLENQQKAAGNAQEARDRLHKNLGARIAMPSAWS